MSSLALIDAMLNRLGGTQSSEETTLGDANNNNNNENETKLPDGYDNYCDLTLTLRGIPEYENYPYKATSDKFLFMADIVAPLFKKTMERAAIDLVCIIDESGSMQGDLITLVKQTVEFIIKNLESNDRFGIVGFAHDSREILALTKMDTIGRETALNECNKIKANGGTALCNGLIDGIQMLKKRNKSTQNKIASVMLFTDGKANRGITNKIKILREMDKYLLETEPENDKHTFGQDDDEKKQQNVIEGQPDDAEDDIFSCSINTFGFGKDHNAALLQEIAERGNGMYSFIETQDYISETFAEALGGLISVCGQNLYVRIKALNNVVINNCLSKRFKKKMIEKNKVMQIIIPDIQSEEKRSLLFELKLPSMADDEKMVEQKDFAIIEWSVEYNNTIINKKEKLSSICTINRISGGLKEIGERNMEVDIQNNRIVAADAMEQANIFAENRKLNEARKIIKNAQNIISTSRAKDDTYCATLVHDLEQCLTKLVSEYEYSSSGRQYMMMNSMSHHCQRSTQSYNFNNLSQAGYRTSYRASMMTNFSKNSNVNSRAPSFPNTAPPRPSVNLNDKKNQKKKDSNQTQ